MRAPPYLAPCALTLLLLLSPTTLVLSHGDKGYQAEDAYSEDPLDLLDDENSTCPTDKLFRTRETCHVDGADIQCIKLHCCDGYVHIAGRCISKSVDPCSLKLCEQACEVRGERMWCTCHKGFQFNSDNYREKKQPYCVDVDECATNNGGCDQSCVNDPGGYHCDCALPAILAMDGRRCVVMPEPLPLLRASSRCYAPCDTVSWLSRKVKQLSDQLRTTQATLKRLLDKPVTDDDRFPEGTSMYRVLDATAPLEGGYCRCERGPRGPAGPPGMEGPKGDTGSRGPRGARGPKGSLDMMLLLLADIRHDIANLEARVYREGESPERFNLQKAWRVQRKQEKLEQESKTQKELEAYTATPTQTTTTENTEDPVEVSSDGETGVIDKDSSTTTDWSIVKGETSTTLTFTFPTDMDEKLREFHLLANSSTAEEEESDDDDEYNFY